MAARPAGDRQPSSWLTLTVAGLAMGMIIFIIASGLTLVFGLMDVLNFGHGVFIALGAFMATSVMAGMAGFADAGGCRPGWRCSPPCGGDGGGRRAGLAFERVIVRPVYGLHLKQILITMGGMIVGEEIIKVIWGRCRSRCRCRAAARGVVLVGDAAIEKYRCGRGRRPRWCSPLLAWTLARTKVGLLIRAGVQDREMVESLGYRIRRLFVGVFVAGSALAGWADVWGCTSRRVGADRRAGQRADLHRHHHRRAGLHAGLLRRRAAGGADGQLHRLSWRPRWRCSPNIALMVAILLWRPQGLYPVTNR